MTSEENNKHSMGTYVDITHNNKRVKQLIQSLTGQEGGNTLSNPTMALNLCAPLMHGCKFSKDRHQIIPHKSVCSSPHMELTENGCEINKTVCSDGTIFNSKTNTCIMSDNICGPGTFYDKTTSQCMVNVNICPSGTHFNKTENKCEVDTKCAKGEIWDKTTNACKIVK